MNGKFRIKDSDKCVHCRICRENCSFLSKYGLDIGDTAELKELAYHCFLCGTCTQVCPLGIDGRAVILDMRRERVEENQGKCPEKGYALVLAEKRNYIYRNKRRLAGRSILFPGCNFPSFYPKTTRKLISLLEEKEDMGVLFDCCGKPVAELGLKRDEEEIAGRINENLRKAGAEEAVMLCPNCYEFLKDKLEVKVISIYEKLARLGTGRQLEGNGALFLPCPDRERKQWVQWLAPFLKNMPETVQGVQCCGLGGCAGGKEPELAREMAHQTRDHGNGTVFTYCASCAGNLTRGGCQGVTHLLPEILGCDEKPDIGKSMVNRMLTKFW